MNVVGDMTQTIHETAHVFDTSVVGTYSLYVQDFSLSSSHC